MGITIAITRAAASTSTGNQDFTTSDLGGLTPKAALFFVTSGITDGVAANHALLSIGACTGASNRWSCGFRCENGVGTSNTDRINNSANAISILNLTGAASADGVADFVSFITNGVRINWSNAPSSAYLVTVVLFAGTDLSALADTYTIDTTNGNTVDINTVGFEPDAVILSSVFTSSATVSMTRGFSYGIVVNDGIDTQRSVSFLDDNGNATMLIDGLYSEQYGLANLQTGAYTYAQEFSTFDANGFSATTREASGSGTPVAHYLALKFNGAASFDLETIDTPTSTGNDAQTGPGFTPQAVLSGMTTLTSVNTITGTGDAGAIGVGAFTSTAEYSNTIASEDGVGTSNTQSLSDDTAIDLPQDDGTSGLVASFVSMDANGYTLNYSAVLGSARKFWALAIEEETTENPWYTYAQQ